MHSAIGQLADGGRTFLYVLTLAPKVTSEDSGELVTAVARWGVAPPPG